MNPEDRSEHPELQTAIEGLLENASLTDALDDDAANLLIDWGIANIGDSLRLVQKGFAR